MAQHKIIVNSSDRVRGTTYDFDVLVQIPNIMGLEKLRYVKVESVSLLTSASPTNLYLASGSFSSPYSYDSNTQNSNSILGTIPLKFLTNDMSYYQASAGDNDAVYSTNIESVLRNNIINLRLVKRDSTLATTFSGEYNVTLTFTEEP